MTNNLVEVEIKKGLLYLSIPLILGGLLESMYNLFDMLWLAGLGEQAVSAAGLGGLFIWLAQGVMLFFKIGSQVLISQYAGAKKPMRIVSLIQNSFRTSLIIGIIIGAILFIWADVFISLLGATGSLKDDAVLYTRIMALGLPSYFMIATYTGIYNGLGKTKVPFVCAAIGLGINIIVDPIFIYHLDMGVAGAAWASVLAFNISILCFISYRLLRFREFPKINWFGKWDFREVKAIVRIGMPPALQSIFFTFVAMVITSMVTPYGAHVLGAQRIGVSIESLCFLVARALQTAMASFVGQNYGAKAYSRINEAYKITLRYAIYYGLIMNFVLFYFAHDIFSIFSTDEQFLYYGVVYLRIVSVSQIAMMIEGVLAGYFSGFGYTKIPSIVGIVGNFVRIPLAYLLAIGFGVYGIWAAVTVSAIVKGLVMFILVVIYRRKDIQMSKRKDEYLNAI